jgi:hypothetical protein
MEKRSKSGLILKILLIFAAVVVFSIAGFIAFILYHLPSGNQLSAAILKPGQRANMAAVNDSMAVTSTMSEPPPVTGNQPPAVTQPQAQTSTTTTVQALNSRAGLDDLISPNKPLSNFCSSLKNAKAGKMTNQEVNRAFQLSLDEATADPRAQALKPVFRYILRLPAFQDLIATVDAASSKQEVESMMEKAAFYSKVVAAAAAMRMHKEDFEAISDRSYLFYKLNEVVAQKPELMSDERLKKFCDDTESAFNNNVPVQFDQEKKNFERLLAELDVEPGSIGYNPDYKTNFDIQMGEKSLTLKGGWLEESFSK